MFIFLQQWDFTKVQTYYTTVVEAVGSRRSVVWVNADNKTEQE